MHSENFLVPLVSILFVALACGWLFERLRQPAIMGYILAGGILGNLFRDLLPDARAFELAGETGLMLMLFFIGSEVDVRRLLGDWKVSLAGTGLQIAGSVLVCSLGMLIWDWSFHVVLFFGFLISLSSTAVILKLLEEFGGTRSRIGRVSLGILLAQDLAVVPMIIILGALSGGEVESAVLARQVLGALVIVGGGVWISLRGGVRLPAWLRMQRNREFHIFMGLIFCMGAASLTGVLGLSPALGAFIAGMVLGETEEGHSIRENLEPLKILFVAVFFVFVGLLFDLSFFLDHFVHIVTLVLVVFVVNSLVTAWVLRLMGLSRVEALVSGCVLAQIGEFSFLLASIGLNSGIIDNDMYQTGIAVISLSLMLTPIWIAVARRAMRMRWGESGTVMFRTISGDGNSG